jgi:hypothetical protein
VGCRPVTANLNSIKRFLAQEKDFYFCHPTNYSCTTISLLKYVADVVEMINF